MDLLKRNLARGLILLAVLAVAAWFVRTLDARQILRDILIRISALGPWAPFWFVVTYVVACLTFFPGVILTLGGGILFGLFKGTLYVSIGATLGAGCAFLLSRYAARDWVIRRFSQNANFRAIDDAVERDGWKIVGLIRLSPAFPFIPLNFVFGLTKIPFTHFFCITWLSILPMSCLFVYLGTLLGDIAALGTSAIVTGKTKWVVSALGLVSTIVVTILVTRIAQRALSTRLPQKPD
ncbi:MAG TPA: TVP38/TMEM64 family protein [Verrucomicrobiae bacterium]|nr:TVP38/TMEM64 family protein [Verrucomicrobiae bacterium]